MDENRSSPARLQWMDFVKAVAICSVVLVHCTEGVYAFRLDGIGQASVPVRIFAFTLFTLGRLGVPLFLMATGYLLLDRDWSTSESIEKFWRKNLCGLFLTTELWIILYYLFLMYFNGRAFNCRELIENVLLLKNVRISHMWYMPVILGIYLFLPLVGRAIRGVAPRLLVFLSFFVINLCFLIPTLNIILRAIKVEQIGRVLNMGFSGGAYGFCLIFGFMCKKNLFRSIKAEIIRGGVLLSIALTVALQMFSYSRGVRYNVWYDAFPLALASFGLFELASRHDSEKFTRIFAILGRYSFGIFLLHNPIRMICLRYIHLQSKVALLCVVYLISLTVSLAILALFQWTPRLRKKLFYVS